MALVMVPSAALACALSCVDTSGSHSPTQAAHTGHPHHDSADHEHLRPAGPSVSTSAHDCCDHDKAQQARTTLPRSDKVGSAGSLRSETSPQPEVGLIVRSHRSTHGPPGFPGHTTQSVLRI